MEKKKSLGQHFLKNTHYAAMMADTAAIKKGERVLEVGPGDGALTRELLKHGARVSAVEKDRRLIPVLRETFAAEIASGHLELLEADVLRLDISRHFGRHPYKVVANIPYYITGALLKKFLTARRQPNRMTLLVQKEVAERIARDPKESILSLSIKAYGTPRYVTTVPRGAFAPPPKVDSAILLIEHISRKHFRSAAHEARFFALLHAGFGKKRKLLLKNIAPFFAQAPADAFAQAGIPLQARAEDVPLASWLALS